MQKGEGVPGWYGPGTSLTEQTGNIPDTTRTFEKTLEGGTCAWLQSPLPMRLQRAKEVQQVLLLRRTQRVEPLDYLLRLGLHATAQQTE